MFEEGKEILKNLKILNWIKAKQRIYLLKIIFMIFIQLVMELEM